jgi:hypothetical protein
MGLWGIIWGILNGPVSAIFADSIPKGERSKYYVYCNMVWLIASSMGPLITIFTF